MGTILIAAILTALLSSVGTVALAAYLFERRYRRHLDRRLEEIGDQLEARVKSGVLAGIGEADIEEQLVAMESRVRAGVAQAATGDDVRELLDQWADEIEKRVSRGVTDAVANIAHPDVIREATINVTEVGTNLITDGLNSLLGGQRKRPKDEG